MCRKYWGKRVARRPLRRNVSRPNSGGQGILLAGIYTNRMGGNRIAANTLCYIDQAKSVGAPSTLIMVFGNGGGIARIGLLGLKYKAV